MHKRLLEFIVLTSQPFTIVDDKSFRSLLLYLNESADIPSSSTVKRAFVSLYEEEKLKMKNLLAVWLILFFNIYNSDGFLLFQETTGKISFIIDGWTSSTQSCFHGVIAQWVDEHWKLRSCILDLRILEGSHTGENLCKSFMETLTEFDVCKKLLAVTTDNAENYSTFMDHLKLELGNKVSWSWDQCSWQNTLRIYFRILYLTLITNVFDAWRTL